MQNLRHNEDELFSQGHMTSKEYNWPMFMRSQFLETELISILLHKLSYHSSSNTWHSWPLSLRNRSFYDTTISSTSPYFFYHSFLVSFTSSSSPSKTMTLLYLLSSLHPLCRYSHSFLQFLNAIYIHRTVEFTSPFQSTFVRFCKYFWNSYINSPILSQYLKSVHFLIHYH